MAWAYSFREGIVSAWYGCLSFTPLLCPAHSHLNQFVCASSEKEKTVRRYTVPTPVFHTMPASYRPTFPIFIISSSPSKMARSSNTIQRTPLLSTTGSSPTTSGISIRVSHPGTLQSHTLKLRAKLNPYSATFFCSDPSSPSSTSVFHLCLPTCKCFTLALNPPSDAGLLQGDLYRSRSSLFATDI